MPYQDIKKNPGNQGPKLVWSSIPQIEEVPYVEHDWTVTDIITATTTVVVTSPHEVDENGAVIIPFPGPTRAEIDELRALSNSKSYTEEDRQHFSQIANIMETAMTERPETAGNGADDDYDAPGEPASREDISPEFSEDRLALRFTASHGKDIRYVAEWGKWLAWTDTHWNIEKTHLAFHLARNICRAAAAECNKPSESKAIARCRTINAVETIARADRRTAATVEQWDSDLRLLNTPGGIVDLKIGILGTIDREKYCTKITAVAPAEIEDCPIFLGFLNDITKKDKEYIAYLQRLFGYCLTGDTSEQMLAFAHGPGGSGKTTLFETIGGIMGSYRAVAGMETFIQTLHPQHSTDVASLMGARMVTASETEEGRRWAEAKIKTLTGGDKITARFMRKDPFTYQPQFKLMIFGNHRPSLRSVDEAWRRRFHLLPFTVAIPKDKQDHTLPAKLKTEWPGILRWAINGCIAWQNHRLKPPNVVIKATEDYLSAEDNIKNWIDEKCTIADTEKETSDALFASWKLWADLSNVPAGNKQTLIQAIKGKLGDKVTENKNVRDFAGLKRGLNGISVNPTPPPEDRNSYKEY